MTTIDLYRKHKAGDISREKFLYEVRRNEQLPWITNLTSYDDAVKILKNKGVVTEVKVEEVFALTPAEESTLGKIVAKYIEDADAISKEMDAYYSKGFPGFSDMLQSNLKRDNEYTSWTQRTNDEEQFRKEIGESLNEDWGSSDQATFNSAIHKDLGNPTEMPMPFDSKFEAAVADAVDFWWDEWDEYREDRDGLIDHAKRAYYRSYFPEEFKGFMEMFSETLNEGKKATKPKKETKTKTVDNVNPYEYRHGLTYELEQLDDYSEDGLEKAIDKVLKNLTKDATFYSTLLNQKQSSFEFKPTQTDAKGMQANADGTLKKGAGKLEKANVKDNLGKKEAGKSNPKGVKTMPDKGVTGTQKIIKEDLFNEEGGNIKIEKQSDGKYYWTFTSKSGKTNKSYDGFDTSAEAQKDFMYRSKYLKEEAEDEFMFFQHMLRNLDSILDILVKENILTQDDIDKLNNGEYPELLNALYAEFDKYKHYNKTGLSIGSSNLYTSAKHIAQKLGKINEEENVNFEENNETQFEDLMKKYDWYYEMSDDSSKFNAGRSIDKQLQNLGSKIGGNKAVEIFNKYAPADRKVTSTFFTINEDKKSKLKELLKAGLKKEIINPKDIASAKSTGDVVNIPAQDTAAQSAARNAKINFRTYK